MVFVKRVELSRFKSFGGNNSVPFLPGFTVISGPNGSGKSNILDALLFCLGLASSKGMRAERLPDLINNSQNSNGKVMETVVSVTFDLENLGTLNNNLLENNQDINNNIYEEKENFYNDNFLENQLNENSDNEETKYENKINLDLLSELKVTRRLRVTKGGSYASTFYLNDSPCTANELHEQLNRLRIYPEGYNVVLQGDVTRIITMNTKERREIIDELAGVAEFDRKIEQTKTTLEAVKEREEKCHIIQDELIENSAKLKQDSEKAAKYQKLKAQIHEKKQWQIVINWRYLQQEKKEIESQLLELESQQVKKTELLDKIKDKISQNKTELIKLNQEVKALGEEEQISVASRLAIQKGKQQQLQQRLEESIKLEIDITIKQEEIRKKRKEYQEELQNLLIKIEHLQTEIIPQSERNKILVKTELDSYKKQAQEIASQSQAWVTQQTTLNQEISIVQKDLNPLLTQQALLTERCQKLQLTIKNENEQLTTFEEDINSKVGQISLLTAENQNSEANIQILAEKLAKIEAEISLNQDTINRLQIEQREKQRQLDKLEATKQAQQEAQGTYGSKIILNSDLPGVCGLVAQLGEVDSAYQLALEIAAGSRLGFIVVEDDSIAAMGIKLLKQHSAGRATFLPLNKIQSPRLNISRDISQAKGFIDLAVNIVKFESKYQGIFAYVFGNTVIFEDLDSARRLMGQGRIVTLEGELLEPSGAMTGGSVSSRSSLKFGRVSSTESKEVLLLSDRIKEIEDTIIHLSLKISEKKHFVKQWSEELNQERQKRQKKQLMLEQCQQEISRLEKEKEKIIESNANNYQNLVNGKQELTKIEQNIPLLQEKLTLKQEELKELESSYDNKEWQNLQQIINQQELLLEERQSTFNENQQNLQRLINKNEDLQIKIEEGDEKINSLLTQENQVKEDKVKLTEELTLIDEDISKYENLFQELAQKLETIKQERNQQENFVKKLENEQQQLQWSLEKLVLQHQESQTKLNELTLQIEEVRQDLPNPLPEIPWLVNNTESGEINNKITFDSLQDQLEQIKREIRKGEKKLEALEPVNMLALEQYEKNQERLEELSGKLTTLAGERTELLLRVENFTTLRLRAFKESFTAVNENFKTIFATLSEGDGYLKLEDENNPFNGGLTLVAHPKGKPVQRLSSMSGGEKSLTALSFIFALQRYRPSPFYAFDEVDMFLDGANVEKLSKMIQQQAKSAQFIVVSLRRPMIEAAQRTIGVTQAKGAYTQVLGIKLN
ncbi:chromosome segregation protein SMC [Geminocystis sp. NIES-3709]|uniref:chromosome segregation protein SMC n=1 Tax=Geminocystis sp. NIES-3709 TaxID=1617448 RepID=UPI0005FC5527|nr:chromosome segregation protein SMC [Geminocystis sp. NIES-3709]BAQ65412.1 chromosome partition protein smc [Geminocystis sp. NIES-3709]